MTLVLLDTNAYLRFARRVRPLLGTPFGQKGYALTILSDVEKEVYRNNRLTFQFPWFDDQQHQAERLAKTVRLTPTEKKQIESIQSVLEAYVRENAEQFTSNSRSPPSSTDCFCLAFGQIRPAIVVTDDLGMHLLASTFQIKIWHGHELLKKMHTAKMINNQLVVEIYTALENNGDLPRSWQEVKHIAFKKIFGSGP